MLPARMTGIPRRLPMSTAYFAGRLKELREAASLTQEQLAGQAGLTKDGIAQLEQGRRKPSWETVLTICTALGVSSEEFRKEPSGRPESGRGRPPKATPATPPAEALEETAKRKRGSKAKRR